jgi:hypothetical protein
MPGRLSPAPCPPAPALVPLAAGLFSSAGVSPSAPCSPLRLPSPPAVGLSLTLDLGGSARRRPPPPARHGLFKGPVVLYSGWRVAGEGLLARARPPPPRFQPSPARASAAPAVGGRGPDGGVASSGRLARQHHLLVLLEAWPPSMTRVPCSVAG